MRAIDTNILVRFVTGDDAKQATAARTVLAAGDVFVATTVILETEWVLRAGYNFGADAIATGLRAIGGLPGMTLEEPAEVAQALDWLGQGIDFADALHLAKAGQCSALVTFDRKLAKRAKGIAPVPVEVP